MYEYVYLDEHFYYRSGKMQKRESSKPENVYNHITCCKCPSTFLLLNISEMLNERNEANLIKFGCVLNT